jgi:hypothetical protein
MEMGKMGQANVVLQEAEALIDPEREPRLLFAIRHNFVDNLTKAGKFAEAAPLLPEVWDLVRAHGRYLDQLRLRWVEARIAAGLGERERGRKVLIEVRQNSCGSGSPSMPPWSLWSWLSSIWRKGRRRM